MPESGSERDDSAGLVACHCEIHRILPKSDYADPRDARSYAGLADSYLVLDDFYEAPWETMPRAQEAAQKAIQLNPNLAEAHTSLGAVHVLHDWDWAGAEKEMKQAIELNPDSSDARMWYAEFLAQMGRNGQAISEIQPAEALATFSHGTRAGQAGFFISREITRKPLPSGERPSIWSPILQYCIHRFGPLTIEAAFRRVLTELPEETVADESRVSLAALAGSYAAAAKRQDAE